MEARGEDASTRARSPRPWIWIGLCLITLLSFGLRFGAVSRLLPMRPEPDLDMVMTYRHLAGEEVPDADFYIGRYPILWPLVLAWTRGPALHELPPATVPLAEHLEEASRAILDVRVLMAAISFLIAPLAFFVARRWVGDAWGLLTAAWLAVALMSVAHASVAKAHGAHATLAWLTVWLALRQSERPAYARVALTAAAGVLTIGTFHSGFFVLLPMLAAAWWARPASRGVRVAAWLSAPAAFLGGLAFTPGGVALTEDVEMGAIHAPGFKLGSTGHGILLDNLDGTGLSRWPVFLWEHDPVLAVLAGLGLACAVALASRIWRASEARREALVATAYVLPYVVLVSLDAGVFERYLLPLYPVFALLAAVAVRALAKVIPSTAARVAVCALLLAFPAYVAARFTWIGRSPTTFDRLAQWIESDGARASSTVLLSPGLALPLLPTAEALERQLESVAAARHPWYGYLRKCRELPSIRPQHALDPLAPNLFQAGKPPSLEALDAYFARARPKLVVLERSKRILRETATTEVYEYVRAHADQIAVFEGEDPRWAGYSPLEYQGVRELATRILRADAFGPRLEVYRWR